jgi:L-ascorbate metabolism protein UlaG (beta-lactamase superfamily)
MPPEPISDGELRFIGTATVLLRCAGFTILTDPNFLHQGDHAPLGGGLRTKRLTDPAMELEDLPPIDLCVLSHHHGDHFDPIVVERLDKDLPIVTEPRSARKLQRQGFRKVLPLETWQHHTIERDGNRLDVTAMPGKHSPRALAVVVPPVMGSMLELTRDGGERFRLYISGDTLLYDRIAEIPRRYPDIDLCLIHLGGTKVAGILLTMDGAMGVRFLQLVAPETAVPIHYDDYTVFKSPLNDFQRAVGAADLKTEVRYVARGETYRFW